MFGSIYIGLSGLNAYSRGLEQVSRRGRLYAARGGTIYLQHVAEAPTRVQARLARLLRDCEAVVTETGKAVHGHALVWGLSLPLWLVDHGATGLAS